MIKKLIPVLILGGLLLAAFLIKKNPPEAERRAPTGGPQMVVEILPVETQDYAVRLQSYGTVQPRTQSILVAQVAGQITDVNPRFRDGGFFEKGDLLAQIDPRDYEANVRIAAATLIDTGQAVAEAEARTTQARKDWDRLGNAATAPDLVLRLPQLEAARARIASAQSSLDKARLDLERTRIVAPYSGRVLQKFVDVGQVVSPNTQLAEIYASDSLEVRLPIRNSDLKFIDLPEAYRDGENTNANSPRAEIRSDLGTETVWQAELVRTESAIDAAARQLHVIAQIGDPYSEQHAGRTPLKIGQYVTANLQGISIDEAIVIPNSSIYQGSYAYVVEDGVLQRKNITIAWQNDRETLIDSGLQPGDQLVTTPLGQVTSGIRVRIAGGQGTAAAPARKQP